MAKAKPKTVSDKQPRKPRAKKIKPEETRKPISSGSPAPVSVDGAKQPRGWNGKLGTEDCDNSSDQPSQPPAVSYGNPKGENKEKDNTKDEDRNEDGSQQPPQTSQTDSKTPQQPAPFPTEVLSSGEGGSGTDSEDSGKTPPAANQDSQDDMGDVALTDAESAVEYSASVQGNLPLARVRDGETRKQCWERLRQEGRTAGMNRRQAISYAGVTVDRVWIAPLPPEPEQVAEEPIAVELPEAAPVEAVEDPEPEMSTAVDKPAIPSSDALTFTIPESWPELPDNASLQAEISWVSANRLRVRDGNGVDLSKAKTPAPSYSALSWLETSILFPSKFADISVKATANQDDEREQIRREKLSIEEIRGLLSEMLEDE